MDPIITFAMSFVVIYFVIITGFKIYTNNQRKKLEALLEKAFFNIVPIMYTEVEGNTVYLYEKKTNAFQCQAATIEDLAKEFGRRNYIAKVLHDNKELWFVEGDVLDEITLTTGGVSFKNV